MDFSIAILPDPERPFGPSEPGVTATARRRNCGEHTATLRIDFLNAIFGDLKQVPAIESCSRMRGDVNRAQRLTARWIEGVQFISQRTRRVAVIGDSMHAVGIRKGAILTEDFSG